MLHQADNVVGVTIEVRSHGNAERGRGAGCNVQVVTTEKRYIHTASLATESPTPAPTL